MALPGTQTLSSSKRSLYLSPYLTGLLEPWSTKARNPLSCVDRPARDNLRILPDGCTACSELNKSLLADISIFNVARIFTSLGEPPTWPFLVSYVPSTSRPPSTLPDSCSGFCDRIMEMKRCPRADGVTLDGAAPTRRHRERRAAKRRRRGACPQVNDPWIPFADPGVEGTLVK
jgi:hypothetical protein